MYFIVLLYSPRSGISGHMVTICLTFWETTILFSKVAVPFYGFYSFTIKWLN